MEAPAHVFLRSLGLSEVPHGSRAPAPSSAGVGLGQCAGVWGEGRRPPHLGAPSPSQEDIAELELTGKRSPTFGEICSK